MAHPPPAQAPKKQGRGCFIAVLLAVLALGLLAGGTFAAYLSVYALTSATAADVPAFNGGDDVYNGADQKLTFFNQALQENQPASFHLSADEINTLLASDPDIPLQNIRLFVGITGDRAAAQVSYPGSLLPVSFYKDRYFNGVVTLGLNFDAGSHTIHFTLHGIKLGGKTIPGACLPLLQGKLNAMLNAKLRKDPDLKNLFDRAKTIGIRDGEFVVETR